MTPMNRTRSQLWIRNPGWQADPLLVHGTLTRRGLDVEGKLPLAESIVMAEPAIGDLIELAGDPGATMALFSGDQVHGDRIEVIDGNADENGAAAPARLSGPVGRLRAIHEFPETDALVTNQSGVLLLIQTADCVPILFWDRGGGVIGACHCGWKGLMARLGQKTVAAMAGLGARPSAIEAWIAPCIRTSNYEVSAEMVRDFAREFPAARVSPDGRHLDLAAIAFDQLAAAGVPRENVRDSGACTFDDAESLYSYRREGAKAGRLLTVIGMIEKNASTQKRKGESKAK